MVTHFAPTARALRSRCPHAPRLALAPPPRSFIDGLLRRRLRSPGHLAAAPSLDDPAVLSLDTRAAVRDTPLRMQPHEITRPTCWLHSCSTVRIPDRRACGAPLIEDRHRHGPAKPPRYEAALQSGDQPSARRPSRTARVSDEHGPGGRDGLRTAPRRKDRCHRGTPVRAHLGARRGRPPELTRHPEELGGHPEELR